VIVCEVFRNSLFVVKSKNNPCAPAGERMNIERSAGLMRARSHGVQPFPFEVNPGVKPFPFPAIPFSMGRRDPQQRAAGMLYSVMGGFFQQQPDISIISADSILGSTPQEPVPIDKKRCHEIVWKSLLNREMIDRKLNRICGK
jgi:hypothetical protein